MFAVRIGFSGRSVLVKDCHLWINDTKCIQIRGDVNTMLEKCNRDWVTNCDAYDLFKDILFMYFHPPLRWQRLSIKPNIIDDD